ncbi:two-component system response regulator [Colwellia sp. 75C3]|uniref:HD domain-containing phosphohydrolase n=1 Tax=Colwellia sp. 75C3 TaxID=888425 RepID=UPI000C32378A|nr:HD domain-containing phosphohydrolase [Colwellia sp. 75C3]PKG80855.1 two-component system response regulator [Colwellia sp. 75C3]
MSKPALLVIDDEKEVLNALNRALRKEFELFLFSDPIAALEFYRDKPTPLVLSDMRMPTMDGATLLGHISEINPSSKRFLLTGHADINLTVAAVNEGKISHYFAKPWDNVELIAELKDAFTVYLSELSTKKLLRVNKEKNAKLSLINSSMELEINKSKKKLDLISTKEAKSFARLKKTFNTFVGIYANSIALHNEEYSQHNYRIASHARYIAELQGCDKLTSYQVYIAGLLYEAGKIALPQKLLRGPYDQLNHQEQSLFDSFYQTGADLLSDVDELSFVVEIIKHIPERYDGSGLPEHLNADDIPLGSRILALVTHFDNLVIGRQQLVPVSVTEAKERLAKMAGSRFDPKLLSIYLDMLSAVPESNAASNLEFPIDLMQLCEGLILTQDIVNSSSSVLLTKGTVIEQSHIDKLIEISGERDEQFSVFIQNRV